MTCDGGRKTVRSEHQPQRKPWGSRGGANDYLVLEAEENIAKMFDASEIDEAAVHVLKNLIPKSFIFELTC